MSLKRKTDDKEDDDDNVGGMLSAVRKKPRTDTEIRGRHELLNAYETVQQIHMYFPLALAVRKLCEAKEGQRQERSLGAGSVQEIQKKNL
ncbi:hypothetical protein ACLKA7_017418 [Drosophila subpalustris]